MSGFGRIGAAVLVALGVGLAGCGGGGGGDDDRLPDPPAPTAEGAYEYDIPNEESGLLMVLENGELWGTYWRGDATPSGLIQGAGSSTGNTYTAPDITHHNFIDQDITKLSATAQFVPGVSFDVTATPTQPPGGDIILNAKRSGTVILYDYETPASATAPTGGWAGYFGHQSYNEAVTAAVSSNGVVSGSVDGTACSFGGSIHPRPSGKNVYDARFDFGSGCANLANRSTSGIAILSTDSNELLVLTQTPDKTGGLTLIASRR